MSERNTVVRSLHDVGLAAWFGGTLAGAVGINGAAADVPDRTQRLLVANAGWARWTPVNLAAIAAHLVGGAGLLIGNKGRIATQRGVGASTVAKLVLTGAALGVTAYSRALGKKLQEADGVPVEGGTEPAGDTPADIAKAQQQLKITQWAIPALTGAIAVLAAVHGEQQRPSQQIPGILNKPASCSASPTELRTGDGMGLDDVSSHGGRDRSCWSGVLVGVGVAAFVDETVFHQLLHWHHFYDGSTSDVGLVSDGIFHAFGWFAVVIGLVMVGDLRRRAALSMPLLVAGGLLGAGAFQLYDGTVQHKLLGLHQIRYDVDLVAYDWTWNVVAVALLVAGAVLLYRSRSEARRGAN